MKINSLKELRSLETGKPKRYGKTIEERFAESFTLNIGTGCWIWHKVLIASGYGALTINHKTVSAHRIAWKIYRGDIPENMFVFF